MTTLSPESSQSTHALFKIKGRMISYEDFPRRLNNLTASLGIGAATIRTSNIPVSIWSMGDGAEQMKRCQGENAVYVLSTKVRYNPSWGGCSGLPRLLDNNISKKSSDGTPAEFIAPFLRLYRFAQENIFLSQTLQGQCLITLPETLVAGGGEGSNCKMKLHLDRMVEPAQDGNLHPLLISGNLHTYEASAGFSRTVAVLTNDRLQGRKVSIGQYLVSALVSFDMVVDKIDSGNPYIETILPYINEIVTHQTPNLRAAEIHLQQMFIRDTARLAAECRRSSGNLLCIAGLDIDMTAFTGEEEHYFVPWQAYVTLSGKTRVKEYSLAQDELFVQLMQEDNHCSV